MKLVEVLARELEVWPVWAYELEQDPFGGVIGNTCVGEPEGLGRNFALADDHALAIVTESEWQAERDRMKAMDTKQATASTEPTYEQQLWDRVYLKTFNEVHALYPTITAADVAYSAADIADAFMVERAKRWKRLEK